MIKRQGIIVYLYYNRDLRKIAKFGDVVYHSYKMRYVHLYVDEDKVDDILKERGGKKVEEQDVPSYYPEIDMDFVGSLERYDTSVLEQFKNFSL